MLMVMQEYISTTLPMMVNTLLHLVSTVLGDSPDDAAPTQTITLPIFTVSEHE